MMLSVCGGPGTHLPCISTKELPFSCVFMCVWAWGGACFLMEVTQSERQSLSWAITSLDQLDCPEKNKVAR